MPKGEEPQEVTNDPIEEWDTIGGGIGDEWDFDRDGALVGNFLGSRIVETTKVESGQATAYQFAPRVAPDTVVFVWGSYEIESALSGDLVRVGDLVRISYLGTRQFTGQDGKPRVVKQFRVQVPRDPARREG